MQSNEKHSVQKESVWVLELGVLEPRSSPHHGDMVLSEAKEPAVALVTGAASVSTTRRA